jgi:hypothetical protein
MIKFEGLLWKITGARVEIEGKWEKKEERKVVGVKSNVCWPHASS